MKRLLLALAGLLAFLPLPARADLIKQSSTYSRTVLMTSASDHVTGATGLVLTITESKAGAAYGSVTPTVTELGSGLYAIALTSTHTGTLGALDLHVTGGGADPSDTHDQVVAFDPADGAALGLTGVATAANQTSAATNLAALSTKVGTPAGASVSADIAAVQTTSNSNGTAIAALPSASAITTGVLGATASSFNSAGTIGAKINSAASAGDPWGTALPGAYSAGTAGFLVGTNLNAAITSRQAGGNVTVGGYATGQAPDTLLLAHGLGHGMTVGQMLVALQAVGAKVATATNSWNGTTHVLTTAYTFSGDGSPTLTTSTQYPSSQVTAPPVATVTPTVGTIAPP